MGRSRSRSPRDHKVKEWHEEATGLIATEKGSTLNFEEISVYVTRQDQAKWVEKAASIFKKYRVLILFDLFSSEVTDLVFKSLQETHQNWSAKYDPERQGNRMSGRYEMMDAYTCWHLTHLPGYLEALEEFAQKGGLKFLEAIGDYKFVGGHGHLCLAGTENWQPLHSDFVQPNGSETLPLWDVPSHVAFMDLLFTLHPLTCDNGALRIIPGVPPIHKTYEQFNSEDGFPPPKFYKEADICKRAGLFPLPTGCGILRDLRIWHGGTPNTSLGDRYTAVLRFYSSWSCELWKDSHYEGKGVDPDDMRRKLSEETQKIVSPHIVRGEGDEAPQLTDSVGWVSVYDGWKHAFSDEPNEGPRPLQTWTESA